MRKILETQNITDSTFLSIKSDKQRIQIVYENTLIIFITTEILQTSGL